MKTMLADAYYGVILSASDEDARRISTYQSGGLWIG